MKKHPRLITYMGIGDILSYHMDKHFFFNFFKFTRNLDLSCNTKLCCTLGSVSIPLKDSFLLYNRKNKYFHWQDYLKKWNIFMNWRSLALPTTFVTFIYFEIKKFCYYVTHLKFWKMLWTHIGQVYRPF